MIFTETRGNDGQHQDKVPFSHAILNPLASYGGLYSPQQLPELSASRLSSLLESGYKDLARSVLDLFQVDIDSAVIDEAMALYDGFDDPAQPVPLVRVSEDLYVSELYHGPAAIWRGAVGIGPATPATIPDPGRDQR